MVHGLIAEAQRDTQLSVAWCDRVVEPLRAQHRVLLNRAIERGRDPGQRRRRRGARHAVRPAYHRLLHGHRSFTGMFVRRVVDVIMDGIAENVPG
jgi:Tetracyclin repressor-like, C-terminal domain